MRLRTGLSSRAALALGVSLLAVGCLAGEGDTDPLLGAPEQSPSSPTTDVSVVEDEDDSVTDAEPDTEEAACPDLAENLGSDIGNVLDVTKTFRTCSGETVSIKDLTCGADVILVDIGAGWCEPCKEEAEHLEKELVQHFADRNVRIISILTEDASGQLATDAVCQQWASTYGITAPVLTDPSGSSKAWVSGDPQTSLPINIIMDGSFVIQNYLVGGQSASSLQEKIENVLAGVE